MIYALGAGRARQDSSPPRVLYMIYYNRCVWYTDHANQAWIWDLTNDPRLTVGFPKPGPVRSRFGSVSINKTHICINKIPKIRFRDIEAENLYNTPTVERPKHLSVDGELILYQQGLLSRVASMTTGLIYYLDCAIVKTPECYYRRLSGNRFVRYNFNKIRSWFNLQLIREVQE